MSQRAMSIDNISFLSPPMSKHEYDFEKDSEGSDANDGHMDTSQNMMENDTTKYSEFDNSDENIIPWKKLLRKTNSRLNLIS